ncbi:MAG: CoB--CoM heterodisulfide reductase iron-sulfur subunit A family protein [Methanophagales archaeon]|nr:CoB--CoM heterodisulfide reductase iron-sulfur subunit A family protein [Methanophagales archaeon]
MRGEEAKIGVYICHCGVNIAATVDSAGVAKFASSLPGVVIARDYLYTCSDPGQEMIRNDIKEYELNRVIVASCSPRMHEPTFRKVVEEAGLNAYLFEMVNIREHCSWVHTDKGKATEKAKDLVRGAVARASLLEPLERMKVGVIPACVVVGGGVSGMFAALNVADKGFKVYLVENEPSIGGHMAQLDKTFPTLDCSACILTPKMVDVARHKNIELITYAEVEGVEGYIGNFKVRVKKKARYVDEEKCTRCGECTKVCPVTITNEFELGLAGRKAAYVPFPQAVPLVYTLERDRCMGCGLCEVVCEAEAINYEQRDEELELEAGVIIVATGYDTFDPMKKPQLGYKEFPNVITGLEFERLTNSSGPTGGEIVINGKEPKDVVFIQCVGSRDEEIGNEYCSRFCCMYTAKHALLTKEHIPDANITILYTDVRAFGKGFEEFYNRAKEEGINYVWKEIDAKIWTERGDSDRVIVNVEDSNGGRKFEADLVVLATGATPRSDAKELARMLRISQRADGFFMETHQKLQPVDTPTGGIFLAGCCQSPKDIPDSVAQACAAAARASIPLMQGEVEIEPLTANVDEAFCVGCRTCELICAYEALSFNEKKHVMVVNEALCKGCGSCSSTCPSGAMSVGHYRDRQLFAQIDGLLSRGGFV